jgi:hypothetical protein
MKQERTMTEKEQGQAAHRIDERVASGEAWNEFCDSLKQLGGQITREDTPSDSFNRAEGFRYLTRLLRNSLESVIEGGSPEFPALRSLGNMVKLGADNPDNLYQGASINGCYDYRIKGNRGSVFYLGFSSISGGYGADGTMITDGFLDHEKLEVNADGSFEIILSQKEHSGNWLPLTEKTRSLNIRQTFLDRSSEKPAQLDIERINLEGTPPPYSAAQLETDLMRVSKSLHGTVKLFADWSASFRPDINTLPPADQAYCQSIGGDPNIFYFHSYWEIGEDEALVIEAKRIPECQTWNFQLDNYWMESLDYRYHRITVNKHTASYEEDGSVILYIAHRDPGVGNWIDTAGHRLGTMCWRWIGTDDHPELQARVVKIGDISC